MTLITLSKFLGAAAIMTAFVAIPDSARAGLTLDQAVQKCTDRAIDFGRKPYGRFAENPPESVVQDQYRACVYANSGRYPSAKVQYRDSVLTLLRDALK